MSENSFTDAKTVQDLVGMLVGAGAGCVDKDGNFAADVARKLVSEGVNRLGEILNNIPATTNEAENLSMEFGKYIRIPFQVEALEITRENIHELSSLIGTFGEDENGPYIDADREKVPTVFKVVPGYWVTRMGPQIRCYSARAFRSQFVEQTPVLEAMVQEIEGKNRG